MKMSRVERQRWLRIRVAVAAYAYEVHDRQIMGDAEFDAMSAKIDTLIETGNAKLDRFFDRHFDPSTGIWIHRHPDLAGIERIYRNHHCAD